MKKMEECLYLGLVFLGIGIGSIAGVWAEKIFEVFSLIALLYFLWYRKIRLSRLLVRPGALPLLALAFYALFQTFPLPPEVLEIVSPGTADLYHGTIWVVSPQAWMPISVHPHSTIAAFGQILSLWAFYIVSLQILNRREIIKRILFVLIVLGLFIAGYAIFFDLIHPGRAAFGSGVLSLSFLLGFCLFLAVRPRQSYLSFRQRLVMLLRYPAAYPHLTLGTGLILLFCGMLLTLSASWFAGLGISFGLVSILLWVRDRKLRIVFPHLFLMFICFLVFALVYLSSGFHSVNVGVAEGRAVMQLVRQALPAGLGFGTNEILAQRLYATSASSAEMDGGALAFILEGGLVGVLLAGWFLLAIIHATLPTWLKRRNRFSVYLYAGSLSAPGMLVGTSLFHPLLPGGWALVSLVLTAAILVMSISVPSVPEKAVNLDSGSSSAGRFGYPFGAMLILFILYAASASLALRVNSPVATRLDPLEDQHRLQQAKDSIRLGDMAKAERDFRSALRLNPLSPIILQEYGFFVDYRGDSDAAEHLLQASILSNPNSEPHLRYVQWLFSNHKAEEGIEHIQRVLLIMPEQTPSFVSLMDQYAMESGQILKILPENALVFVEFGDFLLSRNEQTMAEKCFEKALSYVRSGHHSSLEAIWKLTHYYATSERMQEALEAARLGVRLFPKDIDLRRWMIRLYENQGLFHLAKEEQKQVEIMGANQKTAAENGEMERLDELK